MGYGLSGQPVRLLDLGRVGAAGELRNNQPDGVMAQRAITPRDPVKLAAFVSEMNKTAPKAVLFIEFFWPPRGKDAPVLCREAATCGIP